jgi:hypothetical protein
MMGKLGLSAPREVWRAWRGNDGVRFRDFLSAFTALIAATSTHITLYTLNSTCS